MYEPSHYWGVGIISLPFSRREIGGYKVPSKYTTDFFQVVYCLSGNTQLLSLYPTYRPYFSSCYKTQYNSDVNPICLPCTFCLARVYSLLCNFKSKARVANSPGASAGRIGSMEGGFLTYVIFFNLPTATYLLFVGDWQWIDERIEITKMFYKPVIHPELLSNLKRRWTLP